MQLSCPKIKLKSFILIVFFFSFIFIFKSDAVAQESVALTVKPVRIGDDNSLLLSPGEKKQIQVIVENNSQMDLQIESQVLDFIVDQDGTTPIPVLDQQDNRWSLASWITLAPAQNYLQAGGSATVNVLIEVPEDASPGGHYAMVLHSPNVGTVEDQTGAGISQRAGTLIYVLVDGAINELAFVSQFNVPKFLEKGPVPMEIKIRNESDIHISPTPKITIKNIFGKEVANLVLDSKNVFPFTERDFSDIWDKKWGFGPYTLSLEAAYGIQGQAVTAHAVIWLVPITIIIIILLSILLIMAVVITLKKKKEQQKQALLEKAESAAQAEGVESVTQPVDDQEQK
jgi:hypothetical protein